MLDFIGTIAISSAIAVVFGAVLFTISVTLAQRLVLAGGVGAWVGLAAATVSSGHFGIPQLALLFTTPLIVAAGLALWSPAVRAAMLRIPMPLLIRLNVVRVLGVFFLFLAGEGRLAGPFPYSAGIGDIITGLLALSVASAAASHDARRRGRIAAWNLFGALDLAVAVFLGITSQNGSPIQLIHVGPGAHAILILPWAFVPTVLVPFFLIAHGIVFAHLRRNPATALMPEGRLDWQAR